GGRGGTLPTGAELYDEASGLRIRPGRLTMVVSADPDASARLADRLGRYLPGDVEPIPLKGSEELSGKAAKRARRDAERRRSERLRDDAERTRGPWGVRLGGTDLAEVPIEEVRRTILVSDTGAQVFAGTLQDAIDPHARLTRLQAERALHA